MPLTITTATITNDQAALNVQAALVPIVCNETSRNLISHQWVKENGFAPWDYDSPESLYTVNGDSST